MLDVGTQIRDYLDATAPAVEAEEIFTERIGAPPVQPLHPRRSRQPIPGWVYAVAAAIVVVALVGGAALLLRPDSTVEPADQPTVTTSAPDDTLAPDEPAALGSAYDVVVDAFTAMSDADWQRFLGHIDTDGPLARNTVASWVRLPGQSQDSTLGGVDHDGDGRISAAEEFLIQAQYLALAPIEVLGCEVDGDAEVCRVRDTSVLHRAAGFEPIPIRVTVRDGRIFDIATREEPHMALGGCAGCTWRSWQWSAYEYHLWLGVIPPEAVCPPGTDFPDMGVAGCESGSLPSDYLAQTAADPLAIWWASMESSGFNEFPWINPDAFAEHRRLIPQWLASRESTAAGDGIGQIEALVAASETRDSGQYLALLAEDAQMFGAPLDAAAEEALFVANMVWSLDECALDANGVVNCVGTRRDDFHGAAGLALQGTFSFTLSNDGRIAGIELDPTIQQRSLNQHLAFATRFRAWLEETHPDVADTFGPAVAGGTPNGADMPAALEHVEEYGAQLTVEHRTVVEDLLATYNEGSINGWQALFPGPEATEPSLEAEASLMAANGRWVLDGDCLLTGSLGETRLTCPSLRSDNFFGAGGLDHRIDYVFTFAPSGSVARYSTVGEPTTNSDWFGDHMQFTDQFKEWLHTAHADVAVSAGFPREGELPDWIDPSLMPLALQYVDEFLAQSPEWP